MAKNNGNKLAYFDAKELILSKIKDNGGWVNAHAHFDRAFTLTESNFQYGDVFFQQKWKLNREIQAKSTVDQIYDRMAVSVEKMLEQGVTAVGSFIDVNPLVKDKAILAAQKIRERYANGLEIIYASQPLSGVLSPEAREWFDRGAEFVDVIGGLPSIDRWYEEEHLDVLLSTAKRLNKMVHVHVDQLNSLIEKETEMLIEKAIEHGMQGRVVAVHGISLAAKPFVYRRKIYRLLRQNGIMMIANPSAYIDDRRTETMVPSHNSMTPVDELIPAGVTVALGTDNIIDLHKPFTDGDMWTELRFLLEGCRYSDIDELVKIATDNGRKVLGLSDGKVGKLKPQLIFSNSQRKKQQNKNVANALLEAGVFIYEPEKLIQFKSGLKAPIFLDQSQLVSSPNSWQIVITALTEKVANTVDLVVLREGAGAVHGLAVAEQLKLPVVIVPVRNYGPKLTLDLPSSVINPLLIEDHVSTGASVLQTIRELDQLGLKISQVLCISSFATIRQDVLFEKVNAKLTSLLSFSQIMKSALALNMLSRKQVEEVEAWYKDPQQWSRKLT